MTKPLLTVELVPSSCWYANVRSNVSKDEWDKIRRTVYRAANYQCEICGGKGAKHPVECHEEWHYDDESHVQKLVRMIALCPACHEVKHIGLAGVRGRREIALKHLSKVNGWSIEEAEKYVDQCFQVWRERTQHQWQLDTSYLKQFGVKV